MPDDRPASKSRNSGRGSPRKAYRTPLLVDYGPIARLTAGGSGVSMEFVFMFAMAKRP